MGSFYTYSKVNYRIVRWLIVSIRRIFPKILTLQRNLEIENAQIYHNTVVGAFQISVNIPPSFQFLQFSRGWNVRIQVVVAQRTNRGKHRSSPPRASFPSISFRGGDRLVLRSRSKRLTPRHRQIYGTVKRLLVIVWSANKSRWA